MPPVKPITAGFSGLNLPDTFQFMGPDSDKEGSGRLDPDIEARWQTLTPAERKAALQSIADEYADANGFDRITITFESIPSSQPNSVVWGDYRSGRFQRLRLNSDLLSDPRLINTAVHEMQHRAQYEGMGSRFPWEDHKDGMSREEAERWRKLNEDKVRNKGGPGHWDSYLPRPVETDARNAGRSYVNNLSYQEFERHIP